VSRATRKPTPKILADALYTRDDFEDAFTNEQRLAMRRAGLRPLIVSRSGNEPHVYDGRAIIDIMRRIAAERETVHAVESEAIADCE
jgi:hypothetical protein